MLRFDIHGVIVDVNKQQRNFLWKELEYFLSEENKAPDISIDFVPKILTTSKLKSIGNRAEFENNKFFVRFQGNRVLIPFHKIGKKIKIISEKSVPLNRVFLESIIEPAVYFKLLTKKFAFIHSSAVFFNKTGIIFPAWMHAGKTELLFEFMKKGADFMADDWTFISSSGDIYAYPRPIRIQRHTFHYFFSASGMHYSNQVDPKRTKVPWRSSKSSSKESHSVSLYDAFPNALIRNKCDLDIIVYLIRYKGKEISVAEEDLDVIIERILSITKYARLYDFLPLYNLYKFAFPKKRNPIIETAENVEKSILKKAFKRKSIYSLKIPLIANPSDVCDILLETIF